MSKVLIVEDEIDIAKTIEFNLKKENFTVLLAENGKKAIEKIKKEKPDIVILDIMIPEINGYEVLKYTKTDKQAKDIPEINGYEVLKYTKTDKQAKDIPVIMLTAKSEEFDKLLGFEFGADDYITKPFSIKELIARIKAILKRYNSQNKTDIKTFKFREMVFDFEKKKLIVENKEVKLTTKEIVILEIFLNSNGKLITKDFLFENVWGMEKELEIDTRTVDVHIMNLRKKLGKYGDLIKTIKGFGWRFETDA